MPATRIGTHVRWKREMFSLAGVIAARGARSAGTTPVSGTSE